MHGSISNEVVKNLDKLVSSRQTNKLRKASNNLTTNHKNQYIEHVKAKPQGSTAMSGILNALEQKEALSIFNQLPQEFAFNTLDCIAPQSTLFKDLFDKLDKNEYIEHVKAKPQGSKSMSGILNALEQKDLFSIFNQLLQKNKAFAFNILDCIRPQYTLFKTLFDQLNIQQKEDYKAHLKTKSTIKAKYILGKFYLNNKESSSNLSTENSNKPLVQNKDDLPAAHFSPIPHAFEETVVEHPFDTRLELSSDKKNQSCSQTVIPFPGFAEFDRNTVTENSTVSSSLTSNENISDSLEGEQLSPESYYNYLINGVTSLQSSIVDDLPKLNCTRHNLI
ncbi:hypothetical protein [Wolbachia pipientis]|uniref:hypothetical protein n=1 Tax=Wolbachia pipientis TaxID=955 RepID=UPI0021BD8878|nr:hypothetical protein [Wolbachia pipientis]